MSCIAQCLSCKYPLEILNTLIVGSRLSGKPFGSGTGSQFCQVCDLYTEHIVIMILPKRLAQHPGWLQPIKYINFQSDWHNAQRITHYKWKSNSIFAIGPGSKHPYYDLHDINGLVITTHINNLFEIR